MMQIFRSKKVQGPDLEFYFGEDNAEACAALASLQGASTSEVSRLLPELIAEYPHYHNIRLAVLAHYREVDDKIAYAYHALEALTLFPHSFLVLGHVRKVLEIHGRPETLSYLDQKIDQLRASFDEIHG